MKIVVTGAESSGKTTLTSDLASHFGIDFVDEYSRNYLLAQNGAYDYYDLAIIAKGQDSAIQAAVAVQDLVLIDTDLLTIKIWSEYKYGKCDSWIIATLESSRPDLYLLCSPDIPWEADPLRENPEDRAELYEIYLNEIVNLKVPYVELTGNREQRLTFALTRLEELINQY